MKKITANVNIVTRGTNWLSGGKAFAERISLYVDSVVEAETVKAVSQKAIKDAESAKEGYARLQGSALGDSIPALMGEADKIIAEAREDMRKASRKWTPQEDDTAMWMAYYNGNPCKDGGKIAIRRWFDANGIKVSTEDLDTICDLLGSPSFARKDTTRNFVNKGGSGLRVGRTEKDFLTVFYRTVAMMMISKGAIRPYMWSGVVQDKYAPKRQAKTQKVSGDADKVGGITRSK